MMDIVSLDAIYSVQKMAEVLVTGPDSEREFILFELQQLLDHCLDDTMKILIPVLCEHVPTWNIDLQIKSAQRLYDVVILDLEPSTANMITCASFGVIHRSRGKAAPEYEELYNLWGSILVECLPNMKWTSQEVRDVVTLVDIHAKEPLYTSRKVAARVIGALAQCLDKPKVQNVILPRAIQLFDDTDIEVRGMVVESLAQVGAALPIRITETEVWPRIERLLEPPEEARLRATAMRTMAHILESHRENSGSSRLFRDLLPSVFGRLSLFARKYAAEDQRLVDDDTYLLLEVASEVFGQFAYSLAMFTRKAFRKDAYKAYAGMATCNGPLIRRNCAFNLPGVAKALGERYAIELSGLCDYLAKDTDEDVRFILAAGIHETTALLAPRGNFERLFTAVCSLLQDENPMVRMNALAHFHDLLTAFAKDGNDPASVRRLAPVFTDLTMLSEGEWRIQKSLAEQLGKCAEIIPPDALLENVLPLLYRLMKHGTPLVREAAMYAIAKSLRNIPNVKDRNLAIVTYWKAAADGPFWMRLALLDGGDAAMQVFSHSRFAELFAPQMLLLADDPVANVRIRVANMLSKMSPMCTDNNTSGLYEQAQSRLMRDTDPDVCSILETHEARAKEHMRKAKANALEDEKKYREEQEYYGIWPRTQKRARGRLGSARGNRIMMHVRRPSLEQSSGQLSVSKAVISAAKASSAAASAMKPSAHPKLAPVDSTLYLGPAMDAENVSPMSRTHDERSVNLPNGTDTGSILASLAQNNSANMPESLDAYGRQLQGRQRSVNEASIAAMNESVPVVQQSMSKQARYEARSKSWNGMLAQLPRQLSMESRLKKSQSKNNGEHVNGWGKQGKDGPKKTLSALRRKKKKRPEAQAQPQTASTMSAEEFGIAGPQIVAARGNPVGNSATASRNKSMPTGGMTDYASMGDLPSGEYSTSAGSGNDQQPLVHAKSHPVNPALIESPIPVVFERDSGLPSFRGNAPWKRNKTANEDLEALSEAAHRKALGAGEYGANVGVKGRSHSRSGTSSFHAASSKVFGLKSHGLASNLAANNAATGSTGDGSSNGGKGGGFLRGLFRRKR